MKSVVITGSTRGIGFGLADAFLALDCNVTISGRSEQGTKQAVDALSNRYRYQKIYGYPCDTTQYDQVEHLWQEAQAQFGKVDIWINNAGVAHAPQKSWEQFKPIFNILASRVEDVAPWLARKILNNNRKGVCIEYSNPFRIMSRVVQSALIKKRNSI
jgi:NAD(P)-dependent dehydrogenase (short-subunit alcohol dehydrogenase family)